MALQYFNSTLLKVDSPNFWIETGRKNGVNSGCALSIMSYMSFAVIGIYTAINLNVNLVSAVHDI